MKQAVNWVIQSGMSGLVAGKLHSLFSRAKIGTPMSERFSAGKLVRHKNTSEVYRVLQFPYLQFDTRLVGVLAENVITLERVPLAFEDIEPISPLEALGAQA
jgi:hypothetical protein